MAQPICRRSFLQIIGAGSAVGLAGCSGTRDTNSNGDGAGGSESRTFDVSEVPIDIDNITLRGVLDDELLITGEQDGGEVVNYAGESDEPLHNVHGDFVPVDGGVAYKAIDEVEKNGTAIREYIIVSGGEELYRNSDGERPRLNDIEIFDSLDGKAVWVDHKNRPGTIIHGTESIETDYDELRSVTTIGGEIGYIGQERRDGYSVTDAVVLDGEVLENFEQGGGGLTNIAGEPAYVRSTDGGEVIVFQGQQFGAEYTSERAGRIRNLFELDGRPAFIASVAPDKMEVPEREEEYVLWHDETEIARHDRIKGPNFSELGPHVTYVEGDISYQFDDEHGRFASDGGVIGGVMYGGELLAPGKNPSVVIGVDGVTAYSVEVEGDEEQVIYGEQNSEIYESVGQPVAANDTLNFAATVEGERKILQAQ